MVNVTRFDKVVEAACGISVVNGVHNYQLYLHFFGDKRLYVNTGVLVYLDAILDFGKSRKVRRKLHKNAVALD